MNAELKNGKLIIYLNLQKPKRSKKGKHFVVATSKGCWESAIEIHGKPVKLVANAFIAADDNDPADELEIPVLNRFEKTKTRKRGAK